MSSLVLGLDMGTTSISAVALDSSGAVVHAVTIPHAATVLNTLPEIAEQSANQILATALKALSEVARRCVGREISGLALTGQMHSTVLLDRARNVIGNVITWQDRRSLTEGPAGTLLSELQQRATEAAMFSTGCRLSAGYLGTTLFAMRRLGQLDPRVASVSFVADWIGSQLTDAIPVTERSHAASSGLFDLVADDWSDEILQAAEIPRHWLPQVCDSGTKAGALSSAVAATTGLPTGLPIFNAIGDNQASVLSALPDTPGAVLINIGTGGQIVWRISEFCRQLPLDTRVLPGDPPASVGRSNSRFMLVGAGLCGGDAIAWVNRTVRHWLSDFGMNVSEDEVWTRLYEKVAAVEDSAGLICEPFFRGTRYEPDRRGVLRGIDTANLTPAHLLASVLNGIAQSMFDVWAGTFRRSGSNDSPTTEAASDVSLTKLTQVAMSGNAVKHNPLLVRAVERRFGVPVEVARHSEEAATGTAMLCGVHLGIWNTIEDARRQVQRAAESAVG